jgi:hypothetical protein
MAPFIKWGIGPGCLALAAIWTFLALRVPSGRPFRLAHLFQSRSFDRVSRSQLIIEAVVLAALGIVITTWLPV